MNNRYVRVQDLMEAPLALFTDKVRIFSLSSVYRADQHQIDRDLLRKFRKFVRSVYEDGADGANQFFDHEKFFLVNSNEFNSLLSDWTNDLFEAFDPAQETKRSTDFISQLNDFLAASTKETLDSRVVFLFWDAACQRFVRDEAKLRGIALFLMAIMSKILLEEVHEDAPAVGDKLRVVEGFYSLKRFLVNDLTFEEINDSIGLPFDWLLKSLFSFDEVAVVKALTAASAPAQTLEREDVEHGIVNVALQHADKQTKEKFYNKEKEKKKIRRREPLE